MRYGLALIAVSFCLALPACSSKEHANDVKVSRDGDAREVSLKEARIRNASSRYQRGPPTSLVLLTNKAAWTLSPP